MKVPQDKIARTKLICVSVTPEMADDLKKLAGMEGITINHKIYQYLKQYLVEHQEQLEACKKLTQNSN